MLTPPLTILSTTPPFEASVQVPNDYVGFAGHFPSSPILPGFVQVQLAVTLLNRVGFAGQLKRVNNGKFLKPITPHSTIRIRVTASESADRLYSVQIFTHAGEDLTPAGIFEIELE